MKIQVISIESCRPETKEKINLDEAVAAKLGDESLNISKLNE